MTKDKQPDLTEGQKQCLRLVDQLLTSKEIARKLNISHFTVDQRLDAARRKLNAPNRKEAARMFVAMEAKNIYEPFVYEAEAVAPDEKSETIAGSNNGEERVSEQTGKTADSGRTAGKWVIFNGADHGVGSLRLTMPTLGGEDHDLSKAEVAAAIFKTAFFSILCVSALTIIIVGLMRVLE